MLWRGIPETKTAVSQAHRKSGDEIRHLCPGLFTVLTNRFISALYNRLYYTFWTYKLFVGLLDINLSLM